MALKPNQTYSSMTQIYTFQEQVKLAKEYEDKLLEYYNTLRECVNITDLRDKEKYRKYDIDFLWLRLTNDIVEGKTMEIKIDFKMSKTGNFFIEIDGWYKTCKAETIIYVNVGRKLAYHIDNLRLHEFIERTKSKYQIREVSTSDFGGYNVKGLLVPYQVLLDGVYPYVEDLTKVL